MKKWQEPIISSIINRAHYLANRMIFEANHRSNKAKGDPKVGGHSSASSGAIHILGALHLVVKSGFDHIANKPHASPADHAFNYLLDLLFDKNSKRLDLVTANHAMSQLRAFSADGLPVFQSYHSAFDPDAHNFFPSGTVGIPPVNAGYLALAYRYAERHGFEVPKAHFWALIGDSEFREGSLFEAVPDFAERQIGNLTWIVDYNRQSLDGHRLVNKESLHHTDGGRIRATMEANGWEVIDIAHGRKRQKLFQLPHGDAFKTWLEVGVSDYELQALLLVREPQELADFVAKEHPALKEFLKKVKPEVFAEALHDLGGHDIQVLIDGLLLSKKNPKKPCLIIAHTLKGWGLDMVAQSANHSALPAEEEIKKLQAAQGIPESEKFARFDESSAEGKFLKSRGHELWEEMREQYQIKARNQAHSQKQYSDQWPSTLDINLKMASYPHTQWMLGQLTAKFTRIANAEAAILKPQEKSWKFAAESLVSMAPDVGTSTNLNPAMDGKIFSAQDTPDYEAEFEVKDAKSPDLVPGEENQDRFLRFEITEANTMSCLGSFGKLRDVLGIPILPLMTVYDFFIKRAHDQFFYNLYWQSSFILAGTPSGVTLSPEGAQHGWKSDFQIPNQITWEPFFCQELDWIFCDAVRRHFQNDNHGRSGVVIRGVTRGIEQKDFGRLISSQAKYQNWSEEQMWEDVRMHVLAGAYQLIDSSHHSDYRPGENVVNLFAMGALGREAITACEQLLQSGIYANLFIVTCPDLLCGNLGHQNHYSHLLTQLKVSGDIFIVPQATPTQQNPSDLVTWAGRRIPIVSVHDGEPGLLDNLGSIVGVKQIALCVRKHSKCGRPEDVYAYHGLDAKAIVDASVEALAKTAVESLRIAPSALEKLSHPTVGVGDWRELWSPPQS